jgi:hypothetical protein
MIFIPNPQQKNVSVNTEITFYGTPVIVTRTRLNSRHIYRSSLYSGGVSLERQVENSHKNAELKGGIYLSLRIQLGTQKIHYHVWDSTQVHPEQKIYSNGHEYFLPYVAYIWYQISRHTYGLHLIQDVYGSTNTDQATISDCVGSEVFTAVTIKNTVFGGVAPCRFIINRCFGDVYSLHLQGRRNNASK